MHSLKTVFITGATSGFGEACAYVFAQNGYRLILNGRRHERLKKLSDDLGKQYDAFALGRDLFDEAALNDWNTMIDTNVKGLLYVSKAIVPLLIKQKSGHIINIGSTAGKEVYERGNVYCATKHAVDALSQAMRIDLLQHNIKVTAIHPGAAETEFSLVRFKGNEAAAKNVYDGFQPLTAADVASVVYYTTTLPPHVCINDLVLTCTQQANSFYTYKK
jgi:NADP-dependent 3-hydroxy acid dehydrogenase YdfG